MAEGPDQVDGEAGREAFAVARALLEEAEADAARIRAEADRYRARREQEAELLVAKARRVLAAAEDKAAIVLARAHGHAAALAADGPGAPSEPVTVIDLVAEERAASGVAAPGGAAEPPAADTGLDRILASAISRAVARSVQA